MADFISDMLTRLASAAFFAFARRALAARRERDGAAPLMAAIIAGYQPTHGLRPDRDTFAEFPGLFPAPYRLTHVRLISRSPWRRLAHIGTPRSRSAPSTCHPPTSRAKGPRETSHNSKTASGGGCGARPSRLRAGSLTPTGGRRFGDQPKQAALAFGMRESLSILGRGAGPRPTRERNRHEQPTHTS